MMRCLLSFLWEGVHLKKQTKNNSHGKDKQPYKSKSSFCLLSWYYSTVAVHNLKVTSNNIILYYSAAQSINSNSTAAVQLCQAVWAELGEIIEARHGWEATQFDPLRQVTTRFDDASQQQKRSQAQR